MEWKKEMKNVKGTIITSKFKHRIINTDWVELLIAEDTIEIVQKTKYC